ncbi:urease accessory protein UreE [Methylophaga sp. UBA2689]|jgi:urease accessory protein|uniref:urease accessory protein UreE n=1 Tax=Methylophaga sp. UBA2689 TaxID=1946878 RepID=UPI0025E36EB6|nr:urease accessory protein UreE [Methylophaga sp. UBA2689]|tara:strand:- start:626 stop:1129 length:504 start_codon:yes stop_codon:yes gene_type:complete
MLSISTKLDHIHSDTEIADVVSLSFDLRQKSRIRVTLQSGVEAALYMQRGTILRGGDFLQADSGEIIEVIAADQAMMKVTATTSKALTRAAYHLGNRHVPLEIGDGWLKLETDSVLKDMLLGLGVQVEELQAPFEPESGAYAAGGGHHHHHDDEHSHDHVHAHGHSH